MLALHNTNWFANDEDARVLTIPSCVERFAAPLFISPPMLGIVFGHQLINAQQQFGRLQDGPPKPGQCLMSITLLVEK